MEPRQTQHTPEFLRRRLRRELKDARTAAGLTQKQVATDLDWHPSKLIRIETGDVAIAPSDVRVMLMRYGVTDEKAIEELVTLAREAKNLPQSWTQYRDVYSPAALTLFAYEGSASTIYKYEPTVVPGLFQTEKYTHALLTEALHLPEKDKERMILARAERQELLDRPDHPELRFIIDEAAIRRAIGGPDVMRGQLQRLAELASRPRITIQVMPFSAGFHVGMTGAFTILQFPGDDNDLLYLENAGGESTNRDDATLVSQYLQHYWDIEALATTPPEFDALIRDAVAIFRRPAGTAGGATSGPVAGAAGTSAKTGSGSPNDVDQPVGG